MWPMTGSEDSPSLPPETRLGRTALSVHDLDATTEFYRTVVGLAILERNADTATLGVDGTPLLVLRRDADASPAAPTRPVCSTTRSCSHPAGRSARRWNGSGSTGRSTVRPTTT